MEKKIKETLTQLLDKLGMSYSNIVITQDNNDDLVIYKVNLSSEEAPIIIGRHGDNLHYLQYLTNLILRKQNPDENFSLILDIENYKADYIQKLIELADEKVRNVIENDIRETFFPLNPYYRRVVHMHIAEKYPEIETESIGEEPNRRILLKKKALSL